MTATTLRAMRWWDLAAAHALEQELFSDAWTETMFWSELAGVPATRYYVVAVRDDHTAGAPGADASSEDEVLVGYAGLYVVGPDADVQTVAVAADAQGAGLGAALLDDLLEQARARGCSRVTLEVREDNARAQDLYARRGFERIGVRRGYYPADGADAIVMQARLAGSAPVRIGVTP